MSDVAAWGDLPRVIQTRDVGAAALDPSAADAARDAALLRLRAYPSLPLLLYLPLTPDAVRAAVPFSESRVVRFRFLDVDDSPPLLRQALDELADDGWADGLLARLAARLRRTPAAVEAAVEALARAPQRCGDADALAAVAGTSRRSLDRWLARAGLAPARRLVVAARVWAAYRLLRDSGFRIEDAVERLGYSDESVLKRHADDVCGASPGALRRMAEDEVLERVTQYAARSAGDEADDGRPTPGTTPVVRAAAV